MSSAAPRAVTLRRSCQACARSKRRCDQRLPRCTRCLSKEVDCRYLNTPLTAPDIPRQYIKKHVSSGRQVTRNSPLPILLPLRLEIAKEYDQSVIQSLVNGMRTFPTSFAQNCKTSFVHPDIYASGLPTSIREIHALCKLHTQIRHEERNAIIVPLLRQKFTELNRRYSGALDFEELLGCSQALLLIQCIVALNEDNQARYSECRRHARGDRQPPMGTGACSASANLEPTTCMASS